MDREANIPFPSDLEVILGARCRFLYHRIKRRTALILEVFDGVSSDDASKRRGGKDP